MIIVTHELNEAIYVSDRVFALSQYWDWKADGHPAPPGASIIYDAVAPVYGPEDVRDPGQFVQQREEVRRVAFQPVDPARPGEHRRFWEEVAAGKGMGVLEQR
jgi:ABC-type nitrate/sulfonate/bicarbonate transport system ATPase subunit